MDNILSKSQISQLKEEIIEIYQSDEIPWVVGYSGGKDSSAVLQLIWNAIKSLPSIKRHKLIHVLTVDTLVESPVISSWVKKSLEKMKNAALDDDMPIQVHLITPEIKNTYWVNLIGRGYPIPRGNFRWCTDRLKISPSNKFVQSVVAKHGEVIMVMGTRKAESSNRLHTLNAYSKKRTRYHLNPSNSMQNAFVYPPIEDWSNDNVWQYLLMEKNPWGHDNKSLLTIYKGASEDGECPLVFDLQTPSCGKSRFGCWVCTLVEKDRSMEAIVQNNNDYSWMIDLLNFRNMIADTDKDRERREMFRMNGKFNLYNGKLIHGPYKKNVREDWLKEILSIQKKFESSGVDEIEKTSIIVNEELSEIRRIWLDEKHEFDDSLPRIYEQIMGRPFWDNRSVSLSSFGEIEWNILKNVCNDLYPNEDLLFQLSATLIDIEKKSSNQRYRRGILQTIENTIRAKYYQDEREAQEYTLESEKLSQDKNVSYLREEENPEYGNGMKGVADVII